MPYGIRIGIGCTPAFSSIGIGVRSVATRATAVDAPPRAGVLSCAGGRAPRILIAPHHPIFPDARMAALQRTSRKLAVLRELAVFLRERRLWWLLPIVTVFVVIAVLLVLAQSSAVAPILYPLF